MAPNNRFKGRRPRLRRGRALNLSVGLLSRRFLLHAPRVFDRVRPLASAPRRQGRRRLAASSASSAVAQRVVQVMLEFERCHLRRVLVRAYHWPLSPSPFWRCGSLRRAVPFSGGNGPQQFRLLASVALARLGCVVDFGQLLPASTAESFKCCSCLAQPAVQADGLAFGEASLAALGAA